jgi:hypothetical protein
MGVIRLWSFCGMANLPVRPREIQGARVIPGRLATLPSGRESLSRELRGKSLCWLRACGEKAREGSLGVGETCNPCQKAGLR